MLEAAKALSTEYDMLPRGGAVLCAVLWRHVAQYVAMLAGMAAVLLIRLLSAHFRWNLPRVKDETL